MHAARIALKQALDETVDEYKPFYYIYRWNENYGIQ